MINKEEKFSPMKRFWMLLKPDQKEITNVYLYSIFKGLLSISMPLGIQAIINFIQGGQVSVSWVLLVTIVILSVFFNGLMQIMQLRITENLQQKIFTRAAFDFAYRIPRIKIEALKNAYAPELMNRFFDIISVQKGLPKILIDFSTALLHVFFGLVLLSLYHPFFIFFCLIIVALLYVVFRFTFKLGLSSSLLESKYKYQLVHWLEELARSANLFKFSSDADISLQKTDDNTEKYLQARESHFKILVWQYSFMVAFKVFIAAGLLIIGGLLVIDGKMNIGQFVAAEIILLLLLNAVEKLILSLDTIYDMLTSLEKIGQVTDLELENTEGANIEEICDRKGLMVELVDVSFKYPNQDNYVLQNINLKVKPGEKIVIAGSNGSGKSSLLNVMAGLYENFDGQLLFANQLKSTLDLAALRKVTGEFLNDDTLFHGTVYENIELGREVSRERIFEVLDALDLTNYIKSLPDGINTMIGAAGISLPNSIEKKVIIARVVCAHPKLLLMEDPVKDLDEHDKKRIIDYLCADENEWTLIVVSNESYFFEKCDRTAALAEGSIKTCE